MVLNNDNSREAISHRFKKLDIASGDAAAAAGAEAEKRILYKVW